MKLVLSAILILLSVTCLAADVPFWIIKGIAKTETSSIVNPDGSLVYVNHKIGLAGERGMFQMGQAAFSEVAKPGETFEQLGTDPEYDLELSQRYLQLLHKRFHGWEEAVEAYNAGHPYTNHGKAYLNSVKGKN